MRNNLILIPALLLMIAIAPLPYGYYTFLRIVVSISAALLAFQAYNDTSRLGGWTVAFSLIAVLFNPIIPVYLARDIWFFLDIGAAGIFFVRWFSGEKTSP